MPGYIEDRWWSKRPDPETGKKYKLSRYGQGMRYRVCGIPGVKDESFRKLEDAKDWLASAQTDSRRGTFIDPDLGKVLLADYFEKVYWPGVAVAVGTSRSMEQKIRAHILPLLGHLPIATIDEEHLRIWVATLQKTTAQRTKLETSTIRVIYDYLSAILNSAVPKRIARNPCSTRGIKPKATQKKARAFAQERAAAIWEALRPRDQIAFDLGLAGGLRQGEVFGFAPEDADESAELLHVRRQLQLDGARPYFKLPKGDKERDVPMSPGLWKRLQAYQARYEPVEITLPWRGPGGPDSGLLTVRLLVTTRYRNAVNQSSWNYDSWKPALAHAGLIKPFDEEAAKSRRRGRGWEVSREWGFHALRHTYASVQLQAGESVVSLSQWLGHDDPGFTLRRYTHFMPEAGSRGRAAMDSWMSIDS